MSTLFTTTLWLIAALLGISLAAGEAYGLLAFSWMPSVVCIWLGSRFAWEACGE